MFTLLPIKPHENFYKNMLDICWCDIYDENYKSFAFLILVEIRWVLKQPHLKYRWLNLLLRASFFPKLLIVQRNPQQKKHTKTPHHLCQIPKTSKITQIASNISWNHIFDISHIFSNLNQVISSSTTDSLSYWSPQLSLCLYFVFILV